MVSKTKNRRVCCMCPKRTTHQEPIRRSDEAEYKMMFICLGCRNSIGGEPYDE